MLTVETIGRIRREHFLKGYRGLSMRSLDLMMDVLGLEIRPRQERKDG